LRDIPVAVIGWAPDDFAESPTNVDHVDGDPARLVLRMMPLVRLHAFETRLKRMLASLEADGMFDPDTGLLTREAFWRDLNKAIGEASERSQALSMARFTFDGPLDARASLDGARLMTRLIRNIDFAVREDDGSLLIVFTQTDLRSAHVVARRVAGALKHSMFPARRRYEQIAANVTLATLKAGDTLDSLMLRVMGSRVVAAE
jgi:PleD family two-component response regulator